jgi:hypothetical protein
MFIYSATLALFTSAAVLIVSASPESDYAEHFICDRYPQLRLCSLRADLDQAIQEVAFMVRAVERKEPKFTIRKFFY